MTVMQYNKGKVHPVMDSHKLNEYVNVFNENADVCAAKLQEWHQQEVNVAITKSIFSSIAPEVTVAILNCDDQRKWHL